MSENGVERDWPVEPSVWPVVLNEIQQAQFLGLDSDFPTVARGVRAMRRIRRRDHLPYRLIHRRVIMSRAILEAWVEGEDFGEPWGAGSTRPA